MVTDINDRNPQFDFLSYSAQVYENRTMVCSSVVEINITKKTYFQQGYKGVKCMYELRIYFAI